MMVTEERRERGFALVELMVVILIVGILIAVALPTYLGTRERSEDRATQTNLRTALVGGLAYYATARDYTGFTAAEAETQVPQLRWISPGPPARGEVAIEVAAGDDLLLASLSPSGTYWCVAQVANSPATSKGGSAAYADVDATTECTQGW